MQFNGELLLVISPLTPMIMLGSEEIVQAHSLKPSFDSPHPQSPPQIETVSYPSLSWPAHEDAIQACISKTLFQTVVYAMLVQALPSKRDKIGSDKDI